MPYRFFDHTGDIGVDLWAEEPAGLFAAAAEALTETLTDPRSVDRRARVTAFLTSSAPDLLLVDWVNELVYRFDAFQWLTREAHVRLTRGDDRWTLTAILDGEAREADRHRLKVLVKAVTYHELCVERTGDGWRGRLVLDV